MICMVPSKKPKLNALNKSNSLFGTTKAALSESNIVQVDGNMTKDIIMAATYSAQDPLLLDNQTHISS